MRVYIDDVTMPENLIALCHVALRRACDCDQERSGVVKRSGVRVVLVMAGQNMLRILDVSIKVVI